jgi:hypothetical protein
VTFPLAAWLLGAVLGSAASVASAQIMSFNVTGAVEEARAFDTLYRSSPGASPAWEIRGKLVVVYRATASSGTVTINANLLANTNPRLANGDLQFIVMRAINSNTILDEAEGPPSEQLTISHGVPIDQTIGTRLAFRIGAGPFSGTCGISGGCTTVEVFLVLVNEPVPQVSILGGSRFPVVLGPPSPTFLQLSLFGLSPLTDVTHVAIDGNALERIASGVVPLNQSPGANKWDRIPQDPVHPDDLYYPGGSSVAGIEDFLGCGGGGCGTSGLRIGMPPGMGPGMHTLNVGGSPYEGIAYHLFFEPATYGLVGNASAVINADFIVIDAQLQVSPAQAEPGSTVTVSGTGFAPNNEIPLRVSVDCCGSHVPIGSASSNGMGAFTAQIALPPANAPPFSSTWSSSDPPGDPATGSILADVGDAAFVAEHGTRGGPKSAPITFIKPGATPTTTTLPPQPCTSDPECDDGDPCTEDTCPAGVCVRTRLTGAAGIACTLPPTGVRPPVCTNESLPRRTEKQYGKANGFLDRAVTKTGKVVRRLVKKADKALKRAGRAVQVANLAGELSDECAQGIGDVIDDLRGRIGSFLEE